MFFNLILHAYFAQVWKAFDYNCNRVLNDKRVELFLNVVKDLRGTLRIHILHWICIKHVQIAR